MALGVGWLSRRDRRSLLRHWRWSVPLAVLMWAGLGAWDWLTGRGLSGSDVLIFAAMGLAFSLALGPLAWLRWERSYRPGEPFGRYLLLLLAAVLWAAVVLGGCVALLSLVG